MNNKTEDSKKFSLLYSKLFIFLVVTIVLSVGVLAFFTFDYNKDVVHQMVGSKGTLLVLVDLSDQISNVSESLNNSQNLSIVNQNGATNMNYVIDVNVTNLDPGNCTISGDVTFELSKSGFGTIVNTSNFTMDGGVNSFTFKSIAINNRVCPQNITTSLSFTELL